MSDLFPEMADRAVLIASRAIMALAVKRNIASTDSSNAIAEELYGYAEKRLMPEYKADPSLLKEATIRLIQDVHCLLAQNILKPFNIGDMPYQVRGCLQEIKECLTLLEAPIPTALSKAELREAQPFVA